MTTDAHVHVWDLAARPQPWTDGLQALQRSFGLDDVAADLRAAGQDAVIVVQTVASAAETWELLALAAAQTLVAGVVGWADLARPDVAGQLEAARSGPGGQALVAVRHQLQEEPDPGWLARPQVRDGLRGGRRRAGLRPGDLAPPAAAGHRDRGRVAGGPVRAGSRGQAADRGR
jgi:L-fuconolactonase